MTKTAFAPALAVGILLSAAAQADDLYCTVTTNSGDQMTYRFTPDQDGDMVEIGVMKNGTLMQHAPDKRPIWLRKTNENLILLRYLPDQRYAITFAKAARPLTNGFVGSEAILTRSGSVQGIGACGFLVQPSKTSPVPERF